KYDELDKLPPTNNEIANRFLMFRRGKYQLDKIMSMPPMKKPMAQAHKGMTEAKLEYSSMSFGLSELNIQNIPRAVVSNPKASSSVLAIDSDKLSCSSRLSFSSLIIITPFYKKSRLFSRQLFFFRYFFRRHFSVNPF